MSQTVFPLTVKALIATTRDVRDYHAQAAGLRLILTRSRDRAP
jgi:hypothetical protein